MKNSIRHFILIAYAVVYRLLIRPLIFLMSAQNAHSRTMWLLGVLDNVSVAQSALRLTSRTLLPEQEVWVGGVKLPHPLILAAGFVKGTGFETEEQALAAVRSNENIIPGWRTMPNLVSVVEFGSFTRWPRLGNSGTVMWRDAKSHSIQNRVGLRNPGVVAAAEFLCRHQKQLPSIYGINVAISPGTTKPKQEHREVVESIGALLERSVFPSWITLNLSCPNTEDDPTGNQTEDKAQRLCGGAIEYLRANAPQEIPLWIKVSPNLSDEQYRPLMRVFADTGVKAVIATNTLPILSPTDTKLIAGVSGGALHKWAVDAASQLMRIKQEGNYHVDVIGCGGVINGKTYQDFLGHGITVVQYYGALIYRGPLAAALILNEV